MKKAIVYIFVVIAAEVLAQAQGTSRADDFIKQSGYAFTSLKECKFWINRDALTIPHQGLQGAILVADAGEMLVVGAVVRLKGNLDPSVANLTKLLKLNHQLDYLKAGFDTDGDLFVRAEINSRCTDAEQFKARLADVIAGAQKAYELTQ